MKIYKKGLALALVLGLLICGFACKPGGNESKGDDTGYRQVNMDVETD